MINLIIKKSSTLIVSMFFTQLIIIILSPIITRLYTPSEFGIFNFILSLSSLISVGASLDFNKAIPLSKNKIEFYDLILISFTTLLFISFTFYLVSSLFIFNDSFFSELNLDVFISIIILLIGTNNIFIQISFLKKDYKFISFTNIFSGLFSNLLKILLAFLDLTNFGLIYSHLFSNFSTMLLNFKYVKFTKIEYNFSLSRIIKTMIIYKKFPLFSAPSNYLYLLGNNLPVLLISAFYGSTINGYFSLAVTIVNLPLSLISNSLSQVVYSELINNSNKDLIKSSIKSLLKWLFFIGLGPFLLLSFFGQEIFSIVFGGQWKTSGQISSIISLMAFSHFLVAPFGKIMEIYNKQSVSFFLNFIRLLIISFVFGLGIILSIEFSIVIFIYSILVSISYGFLLIIILKEVSII